VTTAHKCGLFVLILWSLPLHSQSQEISSDRVLRQTRASRHKAPATITSDDGLSIIAVALDLQAARRRETDCSHLVHAIYGQAGFSYPYASSSELYQGTDSFRRVSKPQPGDLVVWNGHVGIVVNPGRRMFFSFLSQGPGIDTYNAQYWKERGPLRFYRYIRTHSEP
jgi:cell wall-associated NlpC family hydrolase